MKKPEKCSLREYADTLAQSPVPVLDCKTVKLFAELVESESVTAKKPPVFWLYPDHVAIMQYEDRYTIPFDILSCHTLLTSKEYPLFVNPQHYLLPLHANLTTDTLDHCPNGFENRACWLDSPLTPALPTEELMATLNSKKRWMVKDEMKKAPQEWGPFEDKTLLPILDAILFRSSEVREKDEYPFAALQVMWAVAMSHFGGVLSLGSDKGILGYFEKREIPVFLGMSRRKTDVGFARQLLLAASSSAHQLGYTKIDTTCATSFYDLESDYGVYKRIAASIEHKRPMFAMAGTTHALHAPYWCHNKGWVTC